MPHDIIDNREIVLLDELAARFPSSEVAKFAVGYFFQTWSRCATGCTISKSYGC